MPNSEYPGTFELLRREVAAQPAKAALLVGLILVGLAIWGPRLARAFIPSGKTLAGSSSVGGQSTPQNTPLVQADSSMAGKDPALGGFAKDSELQRELGLSLNAPARLQWLEILEQVLNDPTFQPVRALPQLPNPFQGSPRPDSSASSLAGTLEPTAKEGSDAGGNSGDIPLEKFLPPLKAVLVTGETRAAILGETLCVIRPGQHPPTIKVRLPEGDVTLVVVAIQPDGVVLQYGEKRFEVNFSPTSSAAEIREVFASESLPEEDEPI
jgi:hypothetical protein